VLNCSLQKKTKKHAELICFHSISMSKNYLYTYALQNFVGLKTLEMHIFFTQKTAI